MKKQNILIYILLSSIFFNVKIFAQKNDTNTSILKYLDSLSISSHVHNEFIIRDLNYDGTYELIEVVNSIENDFPGFLPAKLSIAFDYHKIYFIDNSGKIHNSSSSEFVQYQKKRNIFYKVWLNTIKTPENILDKDLIELININKKEFIEELLRLIALTDTSKSP